jgi:UDP-2,3-diacylglucosamine pyrophosphatase LpxH
MKTKYRTLFISDVHLGTKVSRSQNLLEFLKSVDVEKIVLLGDIIDVSAIRRKFYWDPDHNALIRRLFKLVKKEVEVVYIPGNHDKELRDMAGMDFAGIKIRKEDIHVTADNRRLLLLHGDKFDGILNEKLMFLYTLGDRCYDIALLISRIANRLFLLFGYDWSLSRYLKTKVKNVVKFINDFEHLVVAEVKNRKVDGVICGHIHTPELRNINGFLYANCGCWTENMSAVVENTTGEIELICLDTFALSELVKNNVKEELYVEDTEYAQAIGA